LPKKIPRLVIL